MKNRIGLFGAALAVLSLGGCGGDEARLRDQLSQARAQVSSCKRDAQSKYDLAMNTKDLIGDTAASAAAALARNQVFWSCMN
ncbi:MAG: hypothetical protein KGZ83_05685 [Sulfuricella sp.]|nr:hypothetical protein [Sulfuricella sp.]